MPVERRPAMPKLPPFALEHQPRSAKQRPYYLLLFFLFFAALLLAAHLELLTLPFYWDEQGQFVPTALDLLRKGALVAQSTVPNVHPPGVEVYLALWYKLFGFSIPLTRVAMLLVAAAGLLLTFLLAIELSRDADGAPAFLPPLFLVASPLFYTQSMMAQLDMPAMVLTLLALLLFLKGRYRTACLACVALVLVKETGLVAPAVFGLVLLLRKDWRRALWFVVPALALLLWLILLHSRTGYWLGNPGFAHYNVEYALNPIRMISALLRRTYYLFFAEFRWIGSLVLLFTAAKCPTFRSEAWKIVLSVSLATVVLVSVLGGAELERYLLPVLPIYYMAVAIGLAKLSYRKSIVATATLLAGLIVNVFWRPPYPFPFENNYAMVDFVRLQQTAAAYSERHLARHTIATAWPFSAALESPDYGYVSRKMKVVETNDFHATSIGGLPPQAFDVLITYTRTWMPPTSVIAIPLVRQFLSRYYEWEPDVNTLDCQLLGLEPEAHWRRNGQQITIYVRKNATP
jgi:4-amino-4-deoxy-L-arabinose transferase-like glycosyltransferase